MFHVLHRIFHARRAQASLSVIFMIGGIAIFIGATIAFVALTFLNSSFGFQASSKAYAVALAGIHDGILQLDRNKDFQDTTGYCVPAATAPCPDSSTLVQVTQSSPSAGQVTIVSDASVSLYRRKLQITVAVSTSTGMIDQGFFQTLSL